MQQDLGQVDIGAAKIIKKSFVCEGGEEQGIKKFHVEGLIWLWKSVVGGKNRKRVYFSVYGVQSSAISCATADKIFFTDALTMKG